MEKNDILFLCNYRWAHGRPGFQLTKDEKRELGVILGDNFERIGQINEKF